MTRRATVAKVQIARKDLRLDEDTYRDILERLTGHRSAADASDDQLKVVLEEFKAKGWKPRVVAGGKPGRAAVSRRPAAADHPSAKKARALWLSLWNLGEVEDPSEAALEAMARRQLKVERLQWADQGQTYKLIEALKAWAERAGWSQNVAGHERGEGQILILKLRLVELQRAKLLGIEPPRVPYHLDADEPMLDGLVRAYGQTIRDRIATETAR